MSYHMSAEQTCNQHSLLFPASAQCTGMGLSRKLVGRWQKLCSRWDREALCPCFGVSQTILLLLYAHMQLHGFSDTMG